MLNKVHNLLQVEQLTSDKPLIHLYIQFLNQNKFQIPNFMKNPGLKYNPLMTNLNVLPINNSYFNHNLKIQAIETCQMAYKHSNNNNNKMDKQIKINHQVKILRQNKKIKIRICEFININCQILCFKIQCNKKQEIQLLQFQKI